MTPNSRPTCNAYAEWRHNRGMTELRDVWERAFTEDVPDGNPEDMIGLRERLLGKSTLPNSGGPLTSAEIDRLIDTVRPCDCEHCRD